MRVFRRKTIERETGSDSARKLADRLLLEGPLGRETTALIKRETPEALISCLTQIEENRTAGVPYRTNFDGRQKEILRVVSGEIEEKIMRKAKNKGVAKAALTILPTTFKWVFPAVFGAIVIGLAISIVLYPFVPPNIRKNIAAIGGFATVFYAMGKAMIQSITHSYKQGLRYKYEDEIKALLQTVPENLRPALTKLLLSDGKSQENEK